MVTVARTALVLVTALMLQVSLVARFSLNGARVTCSYCSHSAPRSLTDRRGAQSSDSPRV